ncbi:MAG: hypothetical protein K2P81_09765 [Bacteriovoracaceae bacterium]|nr:hypothetical protein [Bacteriovoracaceae bacterium]
MKKNVVLLLSLVLWAAFSNAKACSIQINALFMRNTLATAAANEFGISLDQVKKITTADYTHQMGPRVAGSSCEEYLEHRVQVTIVYAPNLLTECTLNVEVVKREYLNAETLPFEDDFFNAPVSSCVRRPLIIRPVRPIPHS